MANQAVWLEIHNGVAQIIMSEPDTLNALSEQMAEGLKKAVQRVKEDDAIRAVILTGSGRAFSAGGNIKGFPTDAKPAVIRTYIHDTIGFIKDLAQLEKPTIAAVNGHCVGAGLSLALACDFVISIREARFSLGFHKIGLVPDLGALYHLPRVVGMAKAKELAMTNRILTSEEAVAYGICLEVVENEGLIDRAQQLANELAQSATVALAFTKTVLNHSFETTLDDILQEEAYVQSMAFLTQDHKEGVRAFLEKTKPVFTGN